MAEGTGRLEGAGSPLASTITRKLARFAALGVDEKVLLAEAWVRIALARLFVRRIYPAISSPPLASRARSGVRERDTLTKQKDLDLWRLERLFLLAARHHPGTVACVPRSHALRGFLARRGHPVRVLVGLRRDGSGRLEAHAWTEVDGRPVAESPVLESFQALRTV